MYSHFHSVVCFGWLDAVVFEFGFEYNRVEDVSKLVFSLFQ